LCFFSELDKKINEFRYGLLKNYTKISYGDIVSKNEIEKRRKIEKNFAYEIAGLYKTYLKRLN